MPNFSLKQQKVDKPVLHLEDEFQVTKTRDNTIALTTKPREVKSTNPEARFKVKRDKDRRLIVDYDLKDASGTTSLTNRGNLSLNAVTASDSWSSDSVLGRNVYSLRKTGPKYITIGSSSDANMKRLRKFMSRRFTLMMWVKFENSGQNELLFSFKAANSEGQHISFTKNTSNVLNFSNYSQALNATLSSPTQWNHLALTYNFRNNKRKIFINGKKVKASRAGTRLNLNSATEAFIGNANGLAFDNANADIYGFQIYKVALPNREIKRIYESTSIRETKQFSLTDSDLKLYYKFNDASSTIRNYGNYTNSSDSINSRSDGNATVQSGLTNITAPFGGSCKRFDGTDDYVTAPAVLKKIFHNTSFTIACWVRFAAISAGGAFFDVADTIANTTGNTAYTRMALGVRSDKVRFTLFDNTLSKILDTTGFTPSTDTWYHLTFILDTSSGRKIYINGELNNSNSVTTTLNINTAGSGEIHFGLYRYLNPDGYDQFDLSEFRVYGSAFSDEAVEALYKSYFKKTKLSQIQGVGPAEKRLFISKLGHVDQDGHFITKPILTASDDLVFHLDFSNPDMYNSSNAYAFDKSGSYITGTLNNFSAGNVYDPDFGNCLQFDGTNDYISASNLDIKAKLNQSEFTVTFWVNFALSDSETVYPVLFLSNANSTANYQGLIIGGKNTIASNNGNYTYINFEFIGSSLQGATPILNNNWYHCAFTYSPEGTNRRRIYVNGVLDAVTTGSDHIINLGTFTGGYFEIGRNPFDSDYLTGKLSDLRIYNRELNGDEIGKIYLETTEKVDYSPYKLSLLNKSPAISKDLMYHFKGVDNPSNNSATDWSGNNHHASSSANLYQSDYQLLTANTLKFDSSDKDYLVLDGFTTGNSFTGVTGASPRSITFWTKITDTATERPVICYGKSDTEFKITIDTDEKVRVYSDSDKYLIFSPALSTSAKQHIAVVIDTINNVNTLIDSCKLFINGSKAYISGTSGSVNTEVNTGNSSNLEIGRDGDFYTSFDGTDDIISIPLGVKEIFHNSSFSITFWWRPQSLSGTLDGIFEARNTNGSTTNQWLFIRYNNSRIDFGFYNNDLLSSNFTPDVNTWYHISMVFDKSVGRKIYINGSLNNSDANKSTLTMDSAAASGYVNIGKFSYQNDYGNMDLSDFKIYSKAISADEISTIYKAGKCSFDNDLVSNLAYHWKLNETFIYKSDNTVRHRSFDGTNDYISLPLSVKDTFHNTSFSIAFWVRLKTSGFNLHKAIFTARNTSSSTNNQILHIMFRTDGNIRFGFYYNDIDTTGFTYSTDIWYHFVCVYVHNTGKRIYLNGSLNNSNSQTTALTMNSSAGTGYVTLGRFFDNDQRYPNMDLSDFRIYSKALSANEVSAIYSGGNYSFTNTYNGSAISNLVYHYKLESSTNLNDSGSNSSHGTNQGTTSVLDTDIRHRSFDGTNDYISLPLSVKDIFHNTSFSISFWWRPQSVTASWRGIFEARNTSSSTTYQWVRIQYYSNQIQFGFWGQDLSSSGFVPYSNYWYYITMVFDTSGGKLIYINGVLNNSNSSFTTALTMDSTAGTGYVNLGLFSYENRYGNMDLSDLRIYSKALSASEVSTIYSAGKYNFSNTYSGATISNLAYQYKLDQDINDSGSNSAHGSNNGTTSSVDTDIHFNNENSDVYNGITHTLSGNTYSYFDGYLDDIRIYNKAVTEDQIKNIYNSGSGGYTNETVQNLQLKINPKDKTSQYVSYNHRSFDGDDYVSLPPEVKASLNNTSFSISFWWRPQSVSDTWRGIFEARNTSSSNGNGLFLIRYYSNQLRADFNGNFNTSNFYPLSNTWYYIVYRYESGSNKKIYINGYENINSNDTQALAMSNDSSGHTVIGASTTYSQYGLMDLSDFRIYSKALSASEISTIYTAGLYNYSNTYSGTTISNLAYQYKFDSTSNVNDSGSNSAHGTNNGTTVGNKKFLSSIVLNDKSGSGLSNNLTVSNINMVEGDKLIFNGVDAYASTSTNISNGTQKTIVLKNKPEMTHESVILGSKASGSSLANGDFQIKVIPCGYSNHTRNLIAQYTFFEGAGTIVYDAAAKTKAWATENRLKFFNSPSWNSTGGPFGEPCIVYDGTNDSTIDNTISSSKPLWRDEVRIHDSPTAFSVSVWFNSSTASGSESATGRYIVDIGILMLIWNLTGSDSDHTQSFVGRQGSSRTIANLYTGETPNLATNTWYHATATWEWSSGTDGVLKAYLNGELITTNTGQAALTQSSYKNLYVGKAIGSGWGYFNGRVSNLQFFNSTLTAGEVKEIYDTAHLAYENYARNRMCMIPHFEERLLAHYRCDEGSGTILHDSSKYKRHGTIRSTSWATHEQFSDLNVLSFDGTDDFVEDIPNFENELNTEYSITCWVKPIYSSDYGAVFSTVQSTNNGFTLFAPWSSSNNNAAFLVRDNIAHDDNQDCEIYTQKTTLKSGEWFHLSVTVSTKHIALYVNGVSNNDMGTSYTDVSESGQSTWKTKGVVGGNSGKLVNPLAPGFKIGVEVYNNIYYNYYQGKLSDLRIYKGTLTGEEVRQIYRSDYFKYQANIKINSKIYNLECDKMLSINQYHNLALVYVSGVEAKLYLNNYQVAGITLPSSQSLNTSNSVTLGAQDLNGTRSLWFEGSIKEFRIYNSELTNKEIHELGYDNERCQLRIQGYESKTSGLANASLINLGNDSTTKITMNGFDTTQAAITTSMPDGVIGKNIVFNGSDEYLSINTSSKLSRETQKNFTISGWIKPSSSDSGTNNPVIAKYGSTDNSKYYKINYDASNGELDFTVTSSIKAAYFDGGNDYIAIPRWDNVKEPWSITFWYLLIDGGDKIVFSVRSRIGNYGWIVYVNQGNYHRIAVNSYNQWCLGSDYNTITSVNGRKDWYHIAITSVNGRQNLYVDGKLTKHSSTYPPFRTWTHTDTQHENFFIGETYTGGGDFYGYLSDLRIYSQELNIEDISRIFKEGLGGYGGNVNLNLELRYKLNNPSNLAEDSSGNRRDGSVQGNTTVKMDSFTTQDHTITTKINTDSWSHFALVADSDTRIMTVFINGIKVAQQEIGNINNDNPEQINIGGDGTNFFTGALCDVRIYDTALETDVIKTLLHDGYGSAFEKLDNKANSQSVEPSLPKGLKIHYNGAASGTTLYDMSGNANHGTLVNGPTITASGKFNSGIVFDGTNDHATITASGIRDSLRNNFSISTWIKFDNLNSSEGIFGVYSSGSTTGSNTNLMLYKKYNSSDGQNEINFTFYGSNFSARIDPTTDWIHIAATYGATPIDKNLISHIPFDKSYSSRYPDKVTRRPHTLNNGPTLVTNDATFDRCYSFDGTNDYVSIHGGVMREINKAVGEGNSGVSCELTVMMWMKANNSPSTSTYSKVFMLSSMIKFNWSHGNSNYLGAYEIGSFSGGSNYLRNVKYSGLSSKYTDWNHYCLTIKKDGTDLKVKIYLNGELDTSPTTSGSNSSGTVTFSNESMRSIDNSGTMFWNSNSVYQAGKIKDFRIYNKVLSDDEISGIMLTKSIYLNGELLVSSSLNDSNSRMSYLNVSSANTATLGAVNDGSSVVRLDGTIDDFRVYDRKITSAEVSLLYNNIKDNFPLIQNTNGEPGKLYGSAYYLSNINRPSNPLPKIKRDNLVIHYTFEGSSGVTILDKNFVDKPKEIYLNRRVLAVSSSDSKNIVSTKVFNGTKNTVGGNWTFTASTDIWTTSAVHNLYNGDIIEFTTNGGGATGYSTGTTYYVISVPTTTTLQLSASSGGSVVDGSANSSGNWAAKTAPSDSPLLYKKCENFNGSSDYIETIFSSIGSNWTFTASSDIWTTSSAHGLKLGDKVILTTNGGGATGYNTSTIYYVISVPSTTTLKLSSTLLGSVVDGSANSSGNWAAKHQPIVLGDSLWSISCWINTNAVNKEQTIWSFSSTSATTNEYKLYITADGNKLSFMFNGDSSAEVDTGRTIYTNNWYNVVVVRKLIGLTESILVYINGEFVSTGNITLGNTTGDPSLKIGARFDKNGNFFGGKIADFRVYDSPLNSYQIQKLYQGEQTNGPIVHYTFDNSSSEIIKDMGSEAAHLTSFEAVLDNIKQKVGTSCLYFNGSTSYCKSSYPGLIGYTNNTGHPMTICFWFRKFKSTATGTFFNYGAANKEIKIQINSSSPYNIEAKVGSVTVESMFSTLDGIDETSEDASGDWNHIALVILPGKNYNNTIKNVRIFVNGVDQTKITSSDTLYETTMNTSDIDEIFLLGRSRNGQYFNGWIDDFRIYDTALSPSELFELYYNIYNYKTI